MIRSFLMESKRIDLTLEEKVQLIKRYTEKPPIFQREIALSGNPDNVGIPV